MKRLMAASLAILALAGCSSAPSPEETFVTEARQIWTDAGKPVTKDKIEILVLGKEACDLSKRDGYGFVRAVVSENKTGLAVFESAIRNLCPEVK